MPKKPTRAPKATGALPRAKREVPDHIKAAADRAEARAKGKKATKPRKPIDPAITPAAKLAPPIVAPEHYEAKGEAKAKIGRPSKYTEAVADAMCNHLAEGFSLKSFCAMPDNPSLTTVYRWLSAHGEFREMYVRAREEQAETLADEIVLIADTEVDVNKARLRIDARKWVASKLKPKRYGDLTKVEHTGAEGGAIEVTGSADLDMARRVAFMLGRAAAKVSKEEAKP